MKTKSVILLAVLIFSTTSNAFGFDENKIEGTVEQLLLLYKPLDDNANYFSSTYKQSLLQGDDSRTLRIGHELVTSINVQYAFLYYQLQVYSLCGCNSQEGKDIFVVVLKTYINSFEIQMVRVKNLTKELKDIDAPDELMDKTSELAFFIVTINASIETLLE